MKRAVFVSIGFVLLVGCGKSNPNGSLSGTIHYKGKPVNGALLHLHPSSGKGIVNVPVTQEGTFSQTEIPPGDYKIVVQGTEPPKGMEKMIEPPKGMDRAKAEEMKQKFQQAHGQEVPTIAFPNKYKKVDTTDLKCTITQGKKEIVTLELND